MTDISPLRLASGRIRLRAADRARRAIDRAQAIDGAVLAGVFTSFDAARIAAEAEALDADEGRKQGALAGVLVSIKDLFDEAGVTTAAGSAILADARPASRDAEAVRRLRAAGAVACGRTSMSEFAYSGIGLNPHFGDPGNALDPARVSGGSSSGAALSVALGIADIGLGTDTGGSVRIPAALNGLAGFKPTQAAVPLDGAFPLSQSYDSIGPLAPSIGECAAIHAVLCASPRPEPRLSRPRVGVLRGPLLDGLDAQVARDFDRALASLAAAGMEIRDVETDLLDGFGDVNRVIVASEAHRIHRDRLDALEKVGDARVLRRIRAAESFGPGDEEGARRRRAEAAGRFAALGRGFDVFAAPTLPTVAPTIADAYDDFDRLNALVLRNPSAVNFLDGCAATVPMHGEAELATGLMLFAPGGQDWTVLEVAGRAEPLLRR